MIKRILKIVWGVHFAIIFMLCIHHLFWKQTPKTKMVVRTIPQHMVAAVQVKPNLVKGEPKAVKPKAVTSTKAKPIEKPIPIAKAKPVEKAMPVAKQVVEKPLPIEKNTPVLSKSDALVVPILKQTPRPHEIKEEEKPSYGQTLIAYLQGCLDLPEFGEVKVDLEIDRNGHLVRFDIIEEKSKKNSEFLKKQLPELAYPCFNDFSHETAVFTITFKNASSVVR